MPALTTAVRGSRTLRRAVMVFIALAATLSTFMTVSDSAQAATATETAAAASVLSMLNSERAANHLPALGRSTALVSSARRHNLAMAQANVLSHQLPGEPSFSTRISQAGVAWHSAAENIGWTTERSSAGADALEWDMYSEKAPNDGHRLNILSSSVHYVGIDTYIDAATGKLWLTEDFADVPGPSSAIDAASIAAHQPIGHFDSATVVGNRVHLLGWAMDPDSKATALYIAVFYNGHFAGYLRAPVARLDVARAKGSGPYQGYSITFSFPKGRYSITTYAVNVGAGSGETLLGGKLVTIG